ncbi:hypothetical protein OH720_11025 [Pseudomonas sp. WJP1]|uniref:hypothetical protein n=1 Tax=Pseudomonas sp. WJP1 TaxID=2986947 RepID=UPI00234B28DA|nr:hypothetical protein [Pseudomonas sp. WJP1]WCM53510.1 hypothetical protein OH720_11025 [Pseudomonas sp. WJP1]
MNTYGPKMAALGTTGNYYILPAIKGGVAESFITGLIPSCEAGNNIVVTSGAAYIPGYGIIVVPSGLSLPISGTTAGTWYHLYLYSNAGTPAVELVSTWPSSPIWGQPELS